MGVIEDKKSCIGKIGDKKIELSYNGVNVCSNGGALLLREVEQEIGLLESLSECILDKRDHRYVEHETETLLSQRVYQIACGYEDGNDCNELRGDAIFKLCNNRLPSGSDLASQPTMSRFENSLDNSTIYKMAEVFLQVFQASYASPPDLVILDADDTNNNTHGNQQLTLFSNYYKEYCYQPLHIYEGLSGKLIATVLKPGCRSKGSLVSGMLKRIIGHLRKKWPKTRFVVRGDSHFASHELMSWADGQNRVQFITGLGGNSVLSKMTKGKLDSAKKKYGETGIEVKTYHSFDYKAGSWSKEQRVVAKIEYNSKGGNVRYIVSDMKDVRAKQLYEKGYCARGAAELRIKDHKLYLKSDRSSCSKFLANQFRLFLHSAAYVLIHTLQKELLRGTQYCNATMETIRLKVLKTGAVVREMVTKVKIEFPASCTTKEEQRQCFNIFQHLRAKPG